MLTQQTPSKVTCEIKSVLYIWLILKFHLKVMDITCFVSSVQYVYTCMLKSVIFDLSRPFFKFCISSLVLFR